MTSINIKDHYSVGKVLLTILTPIILYWRNFNLLINESLYNELSTYIIAIPFLLSYILYRIRKRFSENANRQNNYSTIKGYFQIEKITGILLCLLSYLIMWTGSYTFYPLEIHLLSLPIFTSGIILIIFNYETLRTLLFPITLLVALIPPPIELFQSIGSSLATISSQYSFLILKTLGLPVTLLSTYGSPIIYLKTPSGSTLPFAIDLACSGLYSLIGFTVFAVFIAYIARGALHKKLSIFALGFPLIYSLNILRITILIIIGYFSGSDTALNIFHLLGGWSLILLGTLLLLFIAEKVLKIQIFGAISDECPHSEENEDLCIECGKILRTTPRKTSRAEVTKLILILAITISLTLIQVPVIAITEGAAEVFIQQPTGEQATTAILPVIEGYELRFIYRDYGFERISGQNASLIYRYDPQDPAKQKIWVGVEIGQTKACLHPWEVCLITWPQTQGQEPTVKQLDLRDIHLQENPPITARYFANKKTDNNNTQILLYWYTRSTFKTQDGYQQKWTKMSVIQYTNDPQEYLDAEEEILPIAEAIASHWRPVVTWSWAALALAENGPLLIIATTTLILATTILWHYFNMNDRIAAKRAYRHVSDPEERSIIEAVRALRKEHANGTAIASKYQEQTGGEIILERLHEKLEEAKKSGLLKKKMMNINDEPYITWRTRF